MNIFQAVKKPDILVKWLHLGMACSVSLCVLFSLAMDPVAKTMSRDLIFFNLHKFIGINFIVISSVYLLWSAKRYGKSLSDLFPWLHRRTYRRLYNEISRCDLSDTYYLSSALQGLGIFFSLTACVLGVWLVLLTIDGISVAADTWLAKSHYLFSLLTMGYLSMHVGAALLHAMIGHKEVFAIGKVLERRLQARAQPDTTPGQQASLSDMPPSPTPTT